ncbi:RNA-binding protein MEX3D-like isoform X2 [Empidonax traillii]|uniref:RNA-binding protein MEX3D-like isoform X2 n=1 Tax=Empidonax traillii TaxID=164674 RepID=UPI000FFD9C4A|nr:RNA-binding protein MEX3D-like isoform X2 [Empidonax traillii]
MSGMGGPAEAEGFSPCQAPSLQTKVFQYRLWDVNQKSLYLQDDQLLAGHLQGANAALEGDKETWGGTWWGWGTLTLTLMAPRVCDPQRRCSGCPTGPSSPPGSLSSWASATAPAALPATPKLAPLRHCSCRPWTSGSCPTLGRPRPPSPSSAPTRTGCGASSPLPTLAGSSAPLPGATSPWRCPAATIPPTCSTSTFSSAEPPLAQPWGHSQLGTGTSSAWRQWHLPQDSASLLGRMTSLPGW